MTEHGKSQPRVYSELNDAHAIVHAGSRDTIAAGIAMFNIAATFISPLRQAPEAPIKVSFHRQPDVTANMVQHLRHLPVRTSVDQPGLDAFCTFVVDVDNQGHVALHVTAPAPQPGDADHYDTFLARLCRIYTERYGNLDDLPPNGGLSIEQALMGLAKRHPGLLSKTAGLAVRRRLSGAAELRAILESIEASVPGSTEGKASEDGTDA